MEDKKVKCFWKGNENEMFFKEFVPETILQVEFKPLLVYNDKYKICLN